MLLQCKNELFETLHVTTVEQDCLADHIFYEKNKTNSFYCIILYNIVKCKHTLKYNTLIPCENAKSLIGISSEAAFECGMVYKYSWDICPIVRYP